MRVSLNEAAIKLQHGEVVAIPTETVYGLAADASNDEALRQIFAIKQRPADHPLIVHIVDISQVQHWASEFPQLAVKLAQVFWPGALTLVLPAQEHVSKVIRGGESTVALRIPNHPVALELLRVVGLSLAAPSANLFTQLSPTSADHVEAGLGEALAVLDGGACHVGIESTIVNVFVDAEKEVHWQILRPGMVSESEIERIAGKPQYALRMETSQNRITSKPKVPGQHALHYSPRTPLQLFKDQHELLQELQVLTEKKLKCAVLCIGETQLLDANTANQSVTILPDQPRLVAEQLYGTLHCLDDLKVDRLLVEMPPDRPEWVAVRDRLSRAGYQ